MIVALLSGLIIGFVLAIAPGPVAVTAMRLSLDKGLKHGVLAAFGTATMDFIYSMVVIFATTAILSFVNHFFDDYPILLLAFQILVVVAVFIYGIVNIKLKDKIVNPEKRTKSKKFKFIDNLSHKGPYLLGIAVAITNIANPTFLPALTYITVNVQKLIFTEITTLNNILFALGFGFGNFLWLYAVSKVLVHYKDKMSNNTLAKIHQYAGVTLIGFGTILGYRVIILTHWHEVFRLLFAF